MAGKYTMSALMRKNKSVLLSLASSIQFINGNHTKADIAEALLIMQDERGNFPSVDPMGNLITGPSKTPLAPAPDDVDYPKSIRLQRIEASQQDS